MSTPDLGPLPEPTLEDHEYEMWGQNVLADFYTADQLRAERQRCYELGVAAERERWQARVEEAFRDGFYSPRTYNDTVLNTAGEAWEEAKAGLLRA